MFVLSFSKKNLKKSLIIGALVVVLSLFLVFFLKGINYAQQTTVTKDNSLIVTTEDDILTFISRYGWQVDEEPLEVRDVIIPETFDEVYNNYNKIQVEQGFNLEKYAGQRVKRWTYTVRNYPETSSIDDYVRINILVCDGIVIGGDVCSVKIDGFMHGFYLPSDEK